MVKLEDIVKLREFIENNRTILSLIDDIRFTDDRISAIRSKEDKLLHQQLEIDRDTNVLKICVAGDFSAGKSTFINSLLGEELLGMDIIPSTAKVVALTFGAEQRYFKVLKTSKERIEIAKEDFDSLSIRDKGNAQRLDDIEHFEVRLCRNNAFFKNQAIA